MRLKLTVNIGSLDATKYGLTETAAGKEITVDDKTAKILADKGWATETGSRPATSAPTSPAAFDRRESLLKKKEA